MHMVALTSSRQYAKDTDKNSRILFSWDHHHHTHTYTYATKHFFFFKLHSPPNHMLLWPHSSPFLLFFSFKPHQLHTLSHCTAFSKRQTETSVKSNSPSLCSRWWCRLHLRYPTPPLRHLLLLWPPTPPLLRRLPPMLQLLCRRFRRPPSTQL